MPDYSRTVQVAVPPETIYAILDDTDRTPEWLARCTKIDNPDNGANHAGTRLRYHYRDGKRTGVMDGSIVTHDVNRRFTMSFSDKMMDVTVDFETAPGAQAGSTTLTHTIDIRTKGVGKLVTPMIRRSLPKQTTDAMDSLKALAERG